MTKLPDWLPHGVIGLVIGFIGFAVLYPLIELIIFYWICGNNDAGSCGTIWNNYYYFKWIILDWWFIFALFFFLLGVKVRAARTFLTPT